MAEPVEYAQKYKEQDVVAIRDASSTDPGYEKDGDMVVCTLADGSTVTVKKDQLTSAAPDAQGKKTAEGAKPATRRE